MSPDTVPLLPLALFLLLDFALCGGAGLQHFQYLAQFQNTHTRSKSTAERASTEKTQEKVYPLVIIHAPEEHCGYL